MNIRRITDLPIHSPEEHRPIEMASFDNEGVTRRLNVGEYVYATEEDAIKKVREIYNNGLNAFIMPYKK